MLKPRFALFVKILGSKIFLWKKQRNLSKNSCWKNKDSSLSPVVWMMIPSSLSDAVFQTRPDAACQGRQARSPGSDVTATAHVKIFEAKNSFKSDVALKHAPDKGPVKKKADQKSEIAPARDDEKRRRKKAVPRTRWSAHLWSLAF